PTRALDVGGEVTIAERKPAFPAERFERGHEGPSLIAPAPPALRVVEACQRVHDGVEIGRYGEPEMLEVVAGIDHGHEVCARHDAAEPQSELGAANAAAQRDDSPACGAHRNKSSSAGRSRVAAGDGGSDQDSPCTSTIGLPSSACPMTSEAALAISSANPVCVTRNACPNKSARPRMSTSAGRPATPSATPTVPWRHARPQLSVMMTASRLRKCAASRLSSAAAEASGSLGSNSTGSAAISGSILERSMPA